MKTLLVTQVVDREDPILGFFHDWIEEFASHCQSIVVITQSTGSYDLPSNVEVLSLGKDSGRGKFSQICTFWKLIWQHRRNYHNVFVHMTPIWIVLGAPLWIALCKPMYLWYEIKRGSIKLRIAHMFVRTVFMASSHGMPFPSQKQVVVGHGIDTDLFVPDVSKRESQHLVAVGRITEVKQYNQIVHMLAELPDTARLTIAGGTITEQDKETERALKALVHTLGLADRVSIGWVAPNDMPHLLQRADVFVHASQGGLDKAVLQAMACGVPVVTSSQAAMAAIPNQCKLTSIADGIQLSTKERTTIAETLRATVTHSHSLGNCIERIVSSMSS